MTSKATSLTTTGPATAEQIATMVGVQLDTGMAVSVSTGGASNVRTGILSKAQSETQSEGPWDRELVKQIAMDIGKDTVAYIEVMYPKAIEATSSTFKLSLRNHIYNQIMAAIEVNDAGQIQARLEDRKKFRREWLATYRRMRRHRKEKP